MRQIPSFVDREASTSEFFRELASRMDLGSRERLGHGGLGVPVPHTDTGRQVEETKVDERIPVKELGTNDPVTSGKGVLAGVKPARVEHLASRSKEAQATV